jgi:hypothetical protein
MKLLILTTFAFAVVLCGCSKPLQTDVYNALAEEFRLPAEGPARAVAVAKLQSSARLEGSYTVQYYDLVPIAMQKERDSFYDSIVFLRQVHFRGQNGKSFVLKEEIYSCHADVSRPIVLRRSVFSVADKSMVFEEFPGRPHRN